MTGGRDSGGKGEDEDEGEGVKASAEAGGVQSLALEVRGRI